MVVSQARNSARLAAGVTFVAILAACNLPFGLGLPTTRALEGGASDGLTGAKSFEITGSYAESGHSWRVDLQVARPDLEHVLVDDGTVKLEAIIVRGTVAYFRGRDFLSQHLGSDPAAQTLVAAAGNAWWRGSASNAPNLTDFTDGDRFKTTFLGSAVTQRIDHTSVDGTAAVDLAGPRADVFITEAAPYQLLRVKMKKGAEADGVTDGDLRFTNFGKDFGIAVPTDVIDFADLSTLPPDYTVVSVDTSACGSPTCLVAADVKNLGGKVGAQAPSSITFTLLDSASGKVLGRCQAIIQPDVGYNATTKVSCAITGLNSTGFNAATVSAAPNNPGHK